MADAKPEEIKDLLGGALFKALYKWMEDSGPVYLLPTGKEGWVFATILTVRSAEHSGLVQYATLHCPLAQQHTVASGAHNGVIYMFEKLAAYMHARLGREVSAYLTVKKLGVCE